MHTSNVDMEIDIPRDRNGSYEPQAIEKYHIPLHKTKKAVYIAMGIDMDGRRDVLGMYIGEKEIVICRLSILNELKNRGVRVYS